MHCTPSLWTIKKYWDTSRLIEMNPSYQRQSEVWNVTAKAHLIDSVLNSYDIPKIYLHSLGSESKFRFAVIDGKQRIGALLEFRENGFPLAKDYKYTGPVLPDGTKEPSGGQYFKDLDPGVARSFDDFQISTTEVSNATSSQIENLFVRLNSGVSLNQAEYRQGYGGKIIDLIGKIETHDFFKRKVSFKDKRFAFKDAAARVIFIEDQLSAKKPLTNITSAALDKHVIAGINRTDEDIFALGQKVQLRLNFLRSCFSDSSRELTKSSAQLYYLWLREIKDNYTAPDLALEAKKFIEDFSELRILDKKKPDSAQDDLIKRFYWLSGQGTNNAESLNERCSILTLKFLEMRENVVAKDQRRNFNDAEKWILWLRSEKTCVECGIDLPDYRSAHADHVVPHARGGKTELNNGRAICSTCNLNKGARL